RRDGRAARQRFELNDAEGVCEARENKDVCRGQMRGQIPAGFFAQKSDFRIPEFQRRLLRSVPNHNLASGQIQCEKRLKVFFDRHTTYGHKNGSRQIKLGRMVGCEEVRVDPSRPGAKLPETSRAEFLLKR